MKGKKNNLSKHRQVVPFGAGDEIRTRYLHLGKVALCQMSYARIDKGYYTKIFANVKSYFPGKAERSQSGKPMAVFRFFFPIRMVLCNQIW